MPNVKGLLADPEFNKLDPASQRHVLGQVDPQFSQLSDDDYNTFRQKVTGAGASSAARAAKTTGGVIDRLATGATGNILAPPQFSGDNPVSRAVTGLGSSLGRTSQAWQDMFTGNANAATPIEMIPGIGPMAVDAGRMLGTPGQRVEGIGAAGALLAPAAIEGAARTSIATRPYQTVEQPLGPGLSSPPGPPSMPAIPPGMKTAADWMLPIPHRLQQLGAHAYEYARKNSGTPAKTTESRVYDIRNSPLDSRAPVPPFDPSAAPPRQFTPADLVPKPPAAVVGDGFRLKSPPQHYADPAEPIGAPPAPTLTRHDLELMGQGSLDLRGAGGPVPSEWTPLKPREPKPVQSLPPRPSAPPPAPFEAAPYEPKGTMGKGVQSGFGPSPKTERPPKPLQAAQPTPATPVRTASASVPAASVPRPLPSPAETAAKIAADKKAAMEAAPISGNGPSLSPGQTSVRQHETNVKVDQQIQNKVNNLAEYLRSKNGTPEHLDQIVNDPALTRQYLNEAHSFGKNKGNAVPKTQYKGLDPGSDTHLQVRQRLLDMIEEEKNQQ